MSSLSQISAVQLNANRQNSAHSTGPRTNNGKQRTRLNGLRHGLTGHTVLMPNEDREVYEAFCAETIASLQPATEQERALAKSIADESWRLNRARAIEQNIFALGEFTAEDTGLDFAMQQAQTWLDHADEIQLLTVYAARIARVIAKQQAELTALQSERKKARAQALEESLLLAQIAQSKGQPYNSEPGFDPNGFGFSNQEIARLLNRRLRLERARQLEKSTSREVRNGRKAA